MNRIYKVIYSKARQCYIVVSELAKSNHKSSQQGADHTNTPALARIIAVALAAGALTWGSVPGVSWAADAQPIINDKGIIVGKNQNIDKDEDETKDFIVIGSLSSDEQKEKDRKNHPYKYMVKRNSIVLGHHASNTMGESIVIGNRSQANGHFQTIMGHRSIIKGYADQQEGGNRAADTYGALSSIYGAFNTIESARPVDDGSSQDSYFSVFKSVDGFGSSINGTMNKTSNARGTMIMGAANIVTHSQPDIIKANVFGTDDSMDDIWIQEVTSAAQYYNVGDDHNLMNISYDQGIAAMKEYAANASGAISVLGNSNASDYAIRSQILGTANTLKGTAQNISANNTINGYGNTGMNVSHSAIVGSSNTVSNGEDNVVVGDYHKLDGGEHNVVLGSMKSQTQSVKKTYISPFKPDMPIEYETTEQIPVKNHTKDIKNAVMVGYNTDVTHNGGVALGADSIASTEDGITGGITGFDALGKKHINSDKDYSTWVSTDAAVSVGGADREVTYDVLDKDGKPVIDKATGKKKQETQIVNSTRQITNLAAGTNGTDAANVAQLKTVDKKIAVIFDDKGSLMSTDAEIKHEILQDSDSFPEGEGQSIALGKGASAWMQGGSKASYMLFGMKKAAGAIAIGEGAQALSQSIDIGNRTYTGDIGDVTISKYWNWGSGSGVGSVLLGTNSYTGGTLSTLIGDYSIMSTVYPKNYDSKKSDSSSYLQNAGAVSVGALNSIESATSGNDFSGVANSIVGLANKTNNANGALIYGAGNTIKDSFADVATVATPDSVGSAAETANSFRESVKANPGGAVLAIGGGNEIDHSIRSQVIGVDNKLTGNLYHKDGKYVYGIPFIPNINEYSTQYNMIDGYNNQVANVNHAYVIGANNIIKGKTFSNETKDLKLRRC